MKEAHETLYHFHKPETEAQANEWLLRYLVRTYNVQDHRSEPHSRIEDWLANLPAEGLREMCTWEQFCRFAREPERRKVGVDARVTIEGTAYEVEPDMAGETVVLLWGLFDDELYAEFGGRASDLTTQSPGQFHCIATAHLNAARRMSGLIESDRWLTSLVYPSPHWPATMCD